MNKKLQVFVSSTYTDLIEERQTAVQAILDAGHIPAGMELFKAGKSQMKTIQKWIDASDVYMLILGGRYGSIEEESGLSYTELEYRYALSKNMPVFSIVLEDNFLFSKAASYGENTIFEKDNICKYKLFKKSVESAIVRFINNIDKIPTIIHSQLNDIINDPDYNLIGWIQSNTVLNNYTNFSEDALYKNNTFLIETILKQKYPVNINDTISNFASTFSREQKIIFDNPCGILNLSERQVRLENQKKYENTIRVTITKILDYLYFDNLKCPFYINFNSTEQQAKTYKVHSLIIDNEDYTSMLEINIQKNLNRGQFIYHVESNKITIQNPSCKIIYAASYECPAIDFFQSHRLSYLCKQFKTTFYLGEDIKQKYSLICSTFSPFSKLHYDDYKAGEMLKPYDEQIILPNWSIPGSGYAATLKYKTKENHI